MEKENSEFGRFLKVSNDPDQENEMDDNEKVYNKQIANDDEWDCLSPPRTFINGVGSRYYNMTYPKKGFAVIFNHYEFLNGNTKRQGTDEDVTKLKKCLKYLQFEVKVHTDLTKDEIETYITQYSEKNYTNYSSLLIVILTHGDVDTIEAYDTSYHPKILWNSFTVDRCPTLIGKPKMFFFQCCRGREIDPGYEMVQRDGKQESFLVKLPPEEDFLFVYPTALGFESYRRIDGSFFIQNLCNELEQNAHNQDLITLLTTVSRNVALGENTKQHKQILCIMSKLTRLIKF
ncbi:caspase-1-like isoform X2 [Rhynchophorus ferrugineus]|uniref:caspase-1-like isoform X2 n=1 Tax=Rhynchophorus ferrugineus TaxID=354439 RepID=UPI003FCDFEA1